MNNGNIEDFVFVDFPYYPLPAVPTAYVSYTEECKAREKNGHRSGSALFTEAGWPRLPTSTQENRGEENVRGAS